MALWPFRRTRTAPPDPVSFSQIRALSPEQWRALLAEPSAESARWIKAAARYGLVEAQLLLGQMLLDGRGVTRNPAAAFGWFATAAGAAHVPAINMLGRCHENGWGTPVDPAMAAELYRRAAEAGHDWGQFNLANLLLRGQGVARDRRGALYWLRRAARQGHAKAMNLIGRAAEEGWDMPADPGQAVAWYRAAAAAGDFRGQYNLGTLLVQTGDIEQAVGWFEKALESENADIIGSAIEHLRSRPEPALRAVMLRARAMRRAALQPVQ